MPQSKPALKQEAQILTVYLLHRTPSKQHTQLYARAVSSQKFDESNQSKTLHAGLRHPRLLPYLDAYDALFRPNSVLRRRLYLMFAILEASPDFTELFLPHKRSKWYLLAVGMVGARGVCRLAIGLILVKAGGL
jgi:hypothetical protein